MLYPQIKNTNNTISKEIRKYKTYINNAKNKKEKINQVNILKIFELLSENLKINIQTYKFDKQNMDIKFQAKYKNAMNFLELLEKMAYINTLNMYYTKSILHVELSLDIKVSKNIDLSNITFEKNIANAFILSKEKNTTKIISKAIIGDNLILNDRWYKVGDRYKQYIIKKIAINFIELEYKNKIIKMEIFDGKNYR
jgi:hypothetical protein